MSALRNIKRRIKGVSQTAQITKTMQNIATSQLSPARQIIHKKQLHLTSTLTTLFVS
ncbi:MAG: F0F1 ATP synthase subunit gamma [Verrucomicrobiae bacterium]|nr:F0F1 ATP synthase subunit gamma [Verrucomicrobiae bacterium]NNJ42667.1 hypothetical protein [Akkermansiaceae bacterium]